MTIKENVKRENKRIPGEMLNRLVDNFNVRVAAVIQQRSAWIKHIIYEILKKKISEKRVTWTQSL